MAVLMYLLQKVRPGMKEEKEKAESKSQCAGALTSHWQKEVTWLSSESRNGVKDSVRNDKVESSIKSIYLVLNVTS
jgi:flavin-dependent dehydrogenase